MLKTYYKKKKKKSNFHDVKYCVFGKITLLDLHNSPTMLHNLIHAFNWLFKLI